MRDIFLNIEGYYHYLLLEQSKTLFSPTKSSIKPEIIDNKVELVRRNPIVINSRYLKKEEGHVILEINSLQNSELEVLIKNSPGWQIWINNEEQKYLQSTTNTFLKVYVTKGINLIELKYYPISLYKGIGASFILIGLIVFLYHKTIGIALKFREN